MARRVLPNDWEDDVSQPTSKQPTVSDTPPATANRRQSSSVAEHLNCAICLQLYDVPKNMPQCGHVFCLGCLQRLHKPPSTLITCPQCRQANALGKNSVEGFQTNVAIRGAVEAIKAQQQKEEEAKAASTDDAACCHDGDSVACPHCNRRFCKICCFLHMEKLKIETLKSAENIFNKSEELSDPQLLRAFTAAADNAFSSANATLDKFVKELRSTFEQIITKQIAAPKTEIGKLRAFNLNQQQKQHSRLMAEMGVLTEMSKTIQSKSVLDMDLQALSNAHSEVLIRERMVKSLLKLTKPDHMPIFAFKPSENVYNSLSQSLSAVKMGAILSVRYPVPAQNLSTISRGLGSSAAVNLTSPGSYQRQQPHTESNKITSPTARSPVGTSKPPVAVRTNTQQRMSTSSATPNDVATCSSRPTPIVSVFKPSFTLGRVVRPTGQVVPKLPLSATTSRPGPPIVSRPFSAITSGAASNHQLVVRYPFKQPQEQSTTHTTTPNSIKTSSPSPTPARASVAEPSSLSATNDAANIDQHPQAQSNVIAPNLKNVTCLASWIQPNRKLFIAAHEPNKISLIDPSGKIVGTFCVVEIKLEGVRPLEHLLIDCIIGCKDKDVLYYTCSYRKQQESMSKPLPRAVCTVDLSDGNFYARRNLKIVSGPLCTSSYRGVAFSETWQVLFSTEESERVIMHNIAHPTLTTNINIETPLEGRLHVLALYQVDETLAWLFCLVKTTLFRLDISRLDSKELCVAATIIPRPHRAHPIFPQIGGVTSNRFCIVDQTLFTSDNRCVTLYDVGSSSNKRLESFPLSQQCNKGVSVLPVGNDDDQHFVVAENVDGKLFLFPITNNR